MADPLEKRLSPRVILPNFVVSIKRCERY